MSACCPARRERSSTHTRPALGAVELRRPPRQLRHARVRMGGEVADIASDRQRTKPPEPVRIRRYPGDLDGLSPPRRGRGRQRRFLLRPSLMYNMRGLLADLGRSVAPLSVASGPLFMTFSDPDKRRNQLGVARTWMTGVWALWASSVAPPARRQGAAARGADHVCDAASPTGVRGSSPSVTREGGAGDDPRHGSGPVIRGGRRPGGREQMGAPPWPTW